MDGDTMKEKRDGRSNIFYILMLLFTVIIMTVGITVTYFVLVGKEEDDSTQVRTGTLYINYVDGKEIKAGNLFPVVEANLNTKENVYKKEFSVKSTGSLDQTMDIYMDIATNEFQDKHLMYALYDSSNNLITTCGIPKSGKVLVASNIFLKSKESKSYTALIWLKETNGNQNNEQDCSFTGEFDILAQQIKYE